MPASVTDYGAAGDPRSGATSLTAWATAVAAALDGDDTTVDARVSAHASDTTSVHGIADTAALATVDLIPAIDLAPALLDATAYGAGRWVIEKTSAADYRFLRDLGDGTWLNMPLTQVAGLNQLDSCECVVPMVGVDQLAASVVWSGFSYYPMTAPTAGYKAKAFTGAAMTSGAKTVTVTGGDSFAATDVTRKITIAGAGAAGADLVSNIATYVSPTQVTVNHSAGTTVTGQAATVWADAQLVASGSGQTATWTTPAASSVGAIIVKTVNAGLAKVTIDGSATRANMLMTAQELVDAGTYPDTILVANGGTLNPTDRCLDSFASSGTNWEYWRAIATGLAPVAHTVVFTVTGYTATGGTGSRVYLTGFAYATGTEQPGDDGVTMVFAQDLVSEGAAASAYEYAHEILPASGASTYTYVGNVHGYETQASLQVVIDGTTVTMTEGETLPVVTSATVRRNTTLRHPETSTTDHAAVLTEYQMSATGLTVRHTTTWITGGTARVSYPAMLPLTGRIFDSALFATQARLDPADFTESGQFKPSPGEQCGTVAMWQSDGPWAALMHVRNADAASFDWAATRALSIEDRAASAGVKWNKVYLTAAVSGSDKSFAPGDVWAAETLYRFSRFPAGAGPVFDGIGT